jgi:hypothetical protein
VNRAVSAGHFLKNFGAVMPQLTSSLKLKNDFAAAFALRGMCDCGFDFA